MIFFKEIKALGTEIEVYLQDEPKKDFASDFAELEKVIVDFEQSFSRFLDNSEINHLNQSANIFSASDEMIKILLLAKNYYQETEGIFDPTILQSLEDLGYKKSFPFNEPGDANHDQSEINFQKIIINENEKIISKPN
ncbi:FAD:protein FMN transferase, partial [Patescibacteria group bacterium]|nr:FAD:protein FMN transferase [Patescibacteria group bacterium]